MRSTTKRLRSMGSPFCSCCFKIYDCVRPSTAERICADQQSLDVYSAACQHVRPYSLCMSLAASHCHCKVIDSAQQSTNIAHTSCNPCLSWFIISSCKTTTHKSFSVCFFTPKVQKKNSSEWLAHRNHQFSASAVELEFLRSERRLRSGKHFA